jgi:hypothetical protein
MGVNPSLSAIFTTTKELPQNKITASIRNALKRPIPLAFMKRRFLCTPIKNWLEKTVT